MGEGSGIELLAAAKINLALHVTGRRADGYHLLDSIAVFADIGDRVELRPAERLSLEVSGRFGPHAPGNASDLAWRAAEAFYAYTGQPPGAAIRIEKNIPAGAGLGGGSADAAAVLAGLNRLHGAGLPAETLAAIGLRLGADVPMCLAGEALRARGIGEDIEPLIGWPALPLVLVWPGSPVSTAACFGALASRDGRLVPDAEPAGAPVDVVRLLRSCRNDLEAAARKLEPVIGDVLRSLEGTQGCLLARMTGSGSACFGLYPTRAAAEGAAAALGALKPHWWVTAAEAR